MGGGSAPGDGTVSCLFSVSSATKRQAINVQVRMGLRKKQREASAFKPLPTHTVTNMSETPVHPILIQAPF